MKLLRSSILSVVMAMIFIVTPTYAVTLKEYLENTKHPEFKNYPVEQIAFTPAKNIDLSSYKNANFFRTRLREGFKNKANFANEYVVISIAHGAALQNNWIVSKKTGKILTVIGSSQGAAYEIDSNLFVTGYDRSIHQDIPIEELGQIIGGGKIYYYILKNNEVALIAEIDPNQKEQKN